MYFLPIPLSLTVFLLHRDMKNLNLRESRHWMSDSHFKTVDSSPNLCSGQVQVISATSFIITFFTRVVHLLQLMNLYWHIVITQSSKFPLWFTLGIIHSMNLETCILTSIIIISQSIFNALKILCSLRIHLSSPQPCLWQLWIFFCLHSFAFFRISYN